LALGAQRSDVLINLVLSTVRVVSAGVAAGVGLYLLVNRAVAHWAYAPSSNPWALLLVAPLLMCVAGLACYLPARRAMSLDPMQALRHE
jgi:ABC-type antimicrobial peptide transport system permease subunit